MINKSTWHDLGAGGPRKPATPLTRGDGNAHFVCFVLFFKDVWLRMNWTGNCSIPADVF